MIQNLRRHEEVVLYGDILDITENEKRDVTEFLKKEYEAETLNYPYQAPLYDNEAALWAAGTIYTAAQLMLYRKHKEPDLFTLLPEFPARCTPSTFLSADLCLRFLPGVLFHLKQIDPEDGLIQVLENQLTQWHYSGINYPLEISRLDFELLSSDPCLRQLYVNRIIDYKNMSLAKHAACKELVKASLGMFAKEFWNDFKKSESIHE